MDLFEYAKSKTLDQESPLASRLRPTTLDEVVGQQHIIGKNTLLYRAIKADKLTSVIFYVDTWDEKITDSLNYLFLLKAIVKEGHTN